MGLRESAYYERVGELRVPMNMVFGLQLTQRLDGCNLNQTLNCRFLLVIRQKVNSVIVVFRLQIEA